jgi:Holliday junction resolvase-like predicted endonuclease
VAEKGSKLSFVEVKSVSRDLSHETSRGYGSRETYRPEENMHPAKMRRLHRAIQTYLLDHKVPERNAVAARP